MSNDRFCVFCGGALKEKNVEHILPQWLLKMTGDPKRSVNFGLDYTNGKTIRFDWSSFVIPSCKSCNTEYSDLEERAKGLMERILQRKTLTSLEYIDFLDWLDKVRVGVWLAYHFIQKDPSKIIPKFHINTRISKKDRMIAIYPIDSDEKGLNTFGAETLVFHNQPSCFSLKVNNILILNMSSDFLFAARCGFPFPRKYETWLDGEKKGLMETSELEIKRRIMHPLIRKRIFKPSIHLYQPIMTKNFDNQFPDGFIKKNILSDPFLVKHTLPTPSVGKGILFCQHLDRVEPILDLNSPIPFQSVKGNHSKPMYELICQVYEFQSYLYEKAEYNAIDVKQLKFIKKWKRELLRINKKYVDYYKSMGKK